MSVRAAGGICEWDKCSTAATCERRELGGTLRALCSSHEKEGESRGYWRPDAETLADARDPYHDGIRDALEEVRLLVDELPDGPHVLELEAKIDELEQRMTGATEPPNSEDSISIRIGRGAAKGLARLLGDPSGWLYAAAQGIAMHSFAREGARLGEIHAAAQKCRTCDHTRAHHAPDAAASCTDCECARFVSPAKVKP